MKSARTLLAVLVLAPAVSLHAANPATTVWFEQPAAEFHQSLVLGNGRIGAMVFGGVDEERIVLNESSVWSGSSADVLIPGGYKLLPEKHGFDLFFGYYDQVHAHTYYPPYLIQIGRAHV